MNKVKEQVWLSVHLFYNEPWEEFLQKAVEPYVNTAIQTGIATQYFFIRYWERGPHIRLRFRGEVEMINTILKPNLEEHFNNYFESMPSRRIEPEYPPNFSEDLKWIPNNTLAYIDYQAERKRYGGDVGMLLSEQQFMLSSKTVLDYVKQKGRSWSYDDAMGTAVKLHLSFIHATGMDLDLAISFFDFYTKNWLPYTFKNIEEEMSEIDFESQSTLSLETFEQSFDAQKEALIPFHTTLWNALEAGEAFEEKTLNNWIAEHRILLQALISKVDAGELEHRPAESQYQFKSTCYPDQELLWSMLSDYIHLTNNRLGIYNRDESYLSFMMMKCLEELKRNQGGIGKTDSQVSSLSSRRVGE